MKVFYPFSHLFHYNQSFFLSEFSLTEVFPIALHLRSLNFNIDESFISHIITIDLYNILMVNRTKKVDHSKCFSSFLFIKSSNIYTSYHLLNFILSVIVDKYFSISLLIVESVNNVLIRWWVMQRGIILHITILIVLWVILILLVLVLRIIVRLKLLLLLILITILKVLKGRVLHIRINVINYKV